MVRSPVSSRVVAVVTLRCAGIGSRPGHRFEHFTQLRSLELTLTYSQMVTSRDITQGLHDVLNSLASPSLQTMRLELDVGVVATSSGRDLQVEDVTSGADAIDHHALHAVLARPAFARLSRATIVLTSRRRLPKDAGRAEGLPEALLALLRTLFAPWRCARGLARLVGGVWGSGRYVGAVDAGAGEEFCWLTGRVEKYAENHLLAGIGL